MENEEVVEEVIEVSTSSDVTLNQSQYEEISTRLDDIKSGQDLISSSLDSISSDVEDINSNTSTLSGISSTLDGISSTMTTGSDVEVPSDYYEYMSDVSGQQVFFLSLILGVILCYLFVCNFRR